MSVFGPHGRVSGPTALGGGHGLTLRYGVGTGVRVPALPRLPHLKSTRFTVAPIG